MTANDSAGGRLNMLVLEGYGIGPEITAATLDVLRAADRAFGLRLDFDKADIGGRRTPLRSRWCALLLLPLEKRRQFHRPACTSPDGPHSLRRT